MWKLIDATQTSDNVNLSDYGITDSGDENTNVGTLTFSDGTTVGYDQSNLSQQAIYYLTD